MWNHVEDSHDVRVVDTGEQFRFCGRLANGSRIAWRAGNRLQRDVTSQPRVEGPVHDPMPAAANLLENAEPANNAADLQLVEPPAARPPFEQPGWRSIAAGRDRCHG